MSKLKMLFFLGLCAVATLPIGCDNSPRWDALCAHVGGILDEEPTEEMCEDLENFLFAACGTNENVIAATECLMAAEDGDGLEMCNEACLVD